MYVCMHVCMYVLHDTVFSVFNSYVVSLKCHYIVLLYYNLSGFD